MTLEQAMSKARRLARVDDTGKLDSEVMDCVNEAMKAFVTRVHDVTKSVYLQVEPVFNTSEFMALNVEIVGGANAMAATDVTAVVARENATGSELAGYLQTRLNAAIGGGTCTITWSPSVDRMWTFVLDAGAGTTSITISDPVRIDYHSACDIIGACGTQTGQYFYGSMPEDCTRKLSLPTDFLALCGDPEWDGDPLKSAPKQMFVSPEIFGTPTRYFVRGSSILLHPSPNRQGIFRICYRYWPTEFTNVSGYQDSGLTGLDYTDDVGLSNGTQYSVDVSIDGAADVSASATYTTDMTWTAFLALLNASVTGCTFDLVSGDLRCESDSEGKQSSISMSAGSVGTDLLAALSASVETAVAPQYTTDVPIEDNYCMAIVYHVASQLLEESFEYDRAMHNLGQFERICGTYICDRENQNTAIFPRGVRTNQWEVEPFEGS